MNRELYRYNFNTKVPFRDVEESLLLAVLAAESLHGRALVRLDASFCLDSKKRSCVVDAATDVGRAIARIFTGCEPHWQDRGRAKHRIVVRLRYVLSSFGEHKLEVALPPLPRVR